MEAITLSTSIKIRREHYYILVFKYHKCYQTNKAYFDTCTLFDTLEHDCSRGRPGGEGTNGGLPE